MAVKNNNDVRMIHKYRYAVRACVHMLLAAVMFHLNGSNEEQAALDGALVHVRRVTERDEVFFLAQDTRC